MKDKFKLMKIQRQILFFGWCEQEILLQAKYIHINCATNGVFLYKCVTLLFTKALVIMVGHVFKNVMS